MRPNAGEDKEQYTRVMIEIKEQRWHRLSKHSASKRFWTNIGPALTARDRDGVMLTWHRATTVCLLGYTASAPHKP